MVVLSTICCGSISLAAVVFRFDRAGADRHGAPRGRGRCCGSAGVRVSWKGSRRSARTASYVIASNHLSYMDTPVILANIPVQFRFLAKRGLFQIPFLGTHLARAGHIPVPRADPRAAIKTMTLAADTIRTKGFRCWSSRRAGAATTACCTFKEGAAYIGIKAGVPIVPIALVGTREILPFGSARIRPGAVTLRIGEPIETCGLSLRDRGAVMDQIRERISAML